MTIQELYLPILIRLLLQGFDGGNTSGGGGGGFVVVGQDTWANVSAVVEPADGETWQLTEATSAPNLPNGDPAQVGNFVQWTGVSWVNLGDIDGPPGPAGTNGATGATGATGAQGPIGPEGPAGPAGPQGPQGVPGPTGPQGQAGDPGVDGVDGVDGLTPTDEELRTLIDEQLINMLTGTAVNNISTAGTAASLTIGAPGAGNETAIVSLSFSYRDLGTNVGTLSVTTDAGATVLYNQDVTSAGVGPFNPGIRCGANKAVAITLSAVTGATAKVSATYITKAV